MDAIDSVELIYPSSGNSHPPSPLQQQEARPLLPAEKQSGKETVMGSVSTELPQVAQEEQNSDGDVVVFDHPHGGDHEFQDAEAFTSNGGVSHLDSGTVAIRAPVSGNAEEEEEEEVQSEEVEDEGRTSESGESGSVSEEDRFMSGESYGSASERMAASSTCSFDAVSPVGSFQTPVMMVPPFRALDAIQQSALMRLNEMHSGLPSLDTTLLLENSSKSEFRSCVGKIAESRKLSEDDEAIRNILDPLLPLLGENVSPRDSATVADDGNVPQSSQEGLRSPMAMPVAKLTDEDDVEGVDDGEDNGFDEHDDNDLLENIEGFDGGDGESNEAEELDAVGMDPLHAGGLPVRGVEDELSSDKSTEREAPTKDPVFTDTTSPVQKSQKFEEDEGEPYIKSAEEGTKRIENLALVVDSESLKLNDEVIPALTENKTEGQRHEKEANEEGGEAKAGAHAMEGGQETEAQNIGETENGINVAQGVEAERDATNLSTLEIEDGAITETIGESESKMELETATTEALPVCPDSKVNEVFPDIQIKPEENGSGNPQLVLDAETEDTECQEEKQDEGGGKEANEEGVEAKAGVHAMEGGDKTEVQDVGLTEKGTNNVQGIESETDPTELSTLDVEDGETTETIGESKSEMELETPISEALPVCQDSKLNCGLPDTQMELEEHVSGDPLLVLDTETDGMECQDKKQGEVSGASVAAPPEASVYRVQMDAKGVPDDAMELQCGSRLPDICHEHDAKVKTVPLVEEDSTLHADVKEMILAQQCSDSLVSGLIHGCEDNDDNDDTDRDDDDETLMESSRVLSALMRSAEPAEPNTDTPAFGGPVLSPPTRPVGLGASMPSLEPAPRAAQHTRSNGATASRSTVPLEDNQLNGEVGDSNEETREKLQTIRVKFLRLTHRLGQSAHNVVVSQVLYRLNLAEQLRGGRSSRGTGVLSFERASAIAEEQEAAGQEELDFACTIMVLGKTGVGKSATINSIFDEVKSETDAFSPATKKVKEITGNVHGIKLRVIDTPGLCPCFADQCHNERIMSSVKRFIKKSPPDIVLYFDRLDMQSRDHGDLPLLRTITDTFGAAIWFNAIVVLTHASSAPPDGASGAPLSYEMFVAQRSHVVQQTIRQAAGDMRLMNPVSLVENHPACRTNRSSQRVLPNGQVWKPQLLLLCFASKILAEANSLLKLQDSSPGRPFGVRPRVPPLPFLLSSLLQSRSQPKGPEEQMGDDDESDEELDEEPESDDEIEYDELPPFRRLTKDELALIDREQRKAYFEELDYREKLFQKKQWKEELRRRRETRKRMAASGTGNLQPSEDFFEEENARSAAVPVPMPDMVLPPSFDSDNPSHRYRYLETASQWLVRPVLETHGWDHDSGYDGFNMEKTFKIFNIFPASLSGQITKDKKEGNLQLEGAASFKHGEGKATLCGVDVQTIGKDLAYTLRSETRFSNFRRNKTTGGLAVTFLGDTVAAGMKLEDRLMVGKRLKLVLNGGAITGRGDVAYGGSFEATVRDKDFPIGRTLTTLGLSVMDWHGDLAIGGNLQSQFMIGKTMVITRGNLNNRGAGQISIRISSSEQLQIALIGIVPILRALIGNRLLSSSSSQHV